MAKFCNLKSFSSSTRPLQKSHQKRKLDAILWSSTQIRKRDWITSHLKLKAHDILSEAPTVAFVASLSLPWADQDDTLHSGTKSENSATSRIIMTVKSKSDSVKWKHPLMRCNIQMKYQTQNQKVEARKEVQTCGFVLLSPSHLGFNFFNLFDDTHLQKLVLPSWIWSWLKDKEMDGDLIRGIEVGKKTKHRSYGDEPEEWRNNRS